MRKKTIILFLTMGALMLSGCNTKIGNTTQQTTESSTTTSSSVTEQILPICFQTVIKK